MARILKFVKNVLIRPETILARFYLGAVERVAKSLNASEQADLDDALRASTRTFHKTVLRLDAVVVMVLPAILFGLLIWYTHKMVMVPGDWYSLQRFGVVWQIVALFLFLTEYDREFAKVSSRSIRRLFDELPKGFSWEKAEEFHEKWRRRSQKLRSVTELTLATAGTFLTGYGDLVEERLGSVISNLCSVDATSTIGTQWLC